MKVALAGRSAAPWLAILFASFFAALAADRPGLREAHAQPAAAATIYAPPGGVVFRAAELAGSGSGRHETFAGLKSWKSGPSAGPNACVVDEGDPRARPEARPSSAQGPGFRSPRARPSCSPWRPARPRRSAPSR